jgi:hypothetical protein
MTKSIVVPDTDNHEKILELFESPKLIGLIGDANSGKSNTLYWIIKALSDTYDFQLYSYGLRNRVRKEIKIFSVEELEVIRNSIIIIDEFAGLFDIDDRKQRKQIETTLRLIFHNNNVILLCGLPENFKKFIASKLNAMIFKQSAIGDCINGSMVKKRMIYYGGHERGASMLALNKAHAILYDGTHYHRVNVPYLKLADTKIDNADILKKKGK